MLTIGSLLVATYFFVPSWAQTSSILAVVVSAGTGVWYFAKGANRGAEKRRFYYFWYSVLVVIAVAFAVVLFRGLWLIGQPI